VLFNSLDFVVFLLVVLTAHFLVLPRSWWRTQKAVLLVASYGFYASWNPPFVLLLLVSSLVDYAVGLGFERAERPVARRALLGISLATNLGILGFFKYGRFFAESIDALLGTSLAGSPVLKDLVLPVGISFYTFQTLSYSIDVYRRQLATSRSFIDFMLYVSFFPQLVAGPIVRAADFLPQLRRRPQPTGSDVEDAFSRMGMGYLKKVVFADGLGIYVDQVFADPSQVGAGGAALAVYAYAFQIYFDFSGYSDIAIGVAQLFGFRLPENFRRPYWAASPREFWQRWHISLSTWLRDYLYISLGGNRHGRVRTYVNLMATMLLGGLWHGAAWTFVAWGAWHGALLSIDRLLRDRNVLLDGRAARWAGRILTFHLVCAGWILFRSQSLTEVGAILDAFARPAIDTSPAALRTYGLLGFAILAHAVRVAPRLRRAHTSWPPWLQGVGYAVLAMFVFFFSPATERFIYFQF